jgi:predicted nucleic acid-binding protein
VSYPYVDTDIIIRLLTGDDQAKQRQAQALFEQVERGKLIVTAPDTVIADAVYVLHSKRLYNRPKAEVAELLIALVRLPAFRVKNRRAVLAALRLYGTNPQLDFTDALIVALMHQSGPWLVCSWDTVYDRVEGITRLEPLALLENSEQP